MQRRGMMHATKRHSQCNEEAPLKEGIERYGMHADTNAGISLAAKALAIRSGICMHSSKPDFTV